jgi:hypothetical protein
LFVVEGAGVTHNPTDQAVIIGVGGGTEALVQARVKFVFVRAREAPVRDVDSQSS